ncbi:MAG: single-stranded DNA-binding protein [Bacteroidota bacterium]|nr:single-stranded DNA-binding protein [Ferruginibacter sp.]
MIKLQIVGNLGKDCIVKEVNGKNVINFSVAHTERFKDAQGNPKERTTWVECAYWTDKTAVAQYLTKGKIVYAEGSPEADAYMNKENQAAATLRMRVQSIQLLGGNSGGDNPGGQQTGNNYQQGGNTSNYNQNNSSSQGYGGSTQRFEPATAAADDLPF